MRLPLAASLLLQAACSGGPVVLVTQEQSRSIRLNFAGPVTADADGDVFVLTVGGVVRYDTDRRQVEELLFERVDLADLAAVPDGPLLVLSGTRLEAVVAGHRILVAQLPGPGLRLAAREDAVYVTAAVGGELRLLRYRIEERSLETILASSQPLGALAAVPGGCLVAVGNGVHKVFDPVGGEVRRALLFAVSAGGIDGLAADEASSTVYFTQGGATYAWRKGRVAPVFPLGGSVAVGGGRLLIADARHSQLVCLPDPLEGTAGDRPPSPVPSFPSGADRRANLSISDRKLDLEPEGLRWAFRITNTSGSWVDRMEVRIESMADETTVLHETSRGLSRLLPPFGSADLSLVVPWEVLQSRGVERAQVKRGRLTLVRARESVSGAKLKLSVLEKNSTWKDGWLTARLSVSNDNAFAVRLGSVDLDFASGSGRPPLHQISAPADVRIDPGTTREFDLPMVREQEWSVLQGRHGTLGWTTYFIGRVSPEE